MSKQQKRNYLLLAADVLLIPGLFLCRWLAGFMLTWDTQCQWVRLGGKCVTCGGTHFVKALLNGQFAEAFQHNQFLFLLTVFLAVSFVLLNLYWLFDVKFAKVILSRVYRFPTLIIMLSLMVGFFLARNIPVFIRVAEILLSSRS